MEEEVLDFYTNFLVSIRTESRAASLISLVDLLNEFGYVNSLYKIFTITKDKDNLADSVDDVEYLITDCVVNLASNMGVAFDRDVAYARPTLVLGVLKMLTGDLEEFEDADSMLGLANEDADGSIIIENLLRFIQYDQSIFIDGLIENVEPRVLTVIRNFLEARIAEDEINDINYEVQTRMIRYARQYPQNNMLSMFMSAAHKQDVKAVAEQLEWEDDSSDVTRAIYYLVGLALLDSSTFDEAYGKTEDLINLLPVDENDHPYVLKEAMKGLREVYDNIPSEIDNE